MIKECRMKQAVFQNLAVYYVRIWLMYNVLEGNIMLPPTVWKGLHSGSAPVKPKNAAHGGSLAGFGTEPQCDWLTVAGVNRN